MEELERIKIVKIKSDKFTFDISELSVNKFLAIESEKQRLSGSQYNKIATTYFTDSLNAANIIDMVATFRVLSPNIESSISTKNFEELSLLDTKELLNIYIKEIAPWYRSWMKEFSTPFGEDVEEDEK